MICFIYHTCTPNIYSRVHPFPKILVVSAELTAKCVTINEAHLSFPKKVNDVLIVVLAVFEFNMCMV